MHEENRTISTAEHNHEENSAGITPPVTYDWAEENSTDSTPPVTYDWAENEHVTESYPFKVSNFF